MHTSLKYLQGWGLHHFPGKSIPMLDHTLCEEIIPDIQPKTPLTQLETFSLCPITCHLRKGTDTLLTATSSQIVVESDEVSPQTSFLWTEKTQ